MSAGAIRKGNGDGQRREKQASARTMGYSQHRVSSFVVRRAVTAVTLSIAIDRLLFESRHMAAGKRASQLLCSINRTIRRAAYFGDRE